MQYFSSAPVPFQFPRSVGLGFIGEHGIIFVLYRVLIYVVMIRSDTRTRGGPSFLLCCSPPQQKNHRFNSGKDQSKKAWNDPEIPLHYFPV